MKLYLIVIISLLFSLNANSQSLKDTTENKESFAVGELGGAFSKDIKGGGWSYGFNASIEVTPIEDWLEIELGASPTFANHLKALDVDLLFKKPWTLSSKTEFMVGAGLAYDRTNYYGSISNSMAGEFALDFMYWPLVKHQFGLYIEPAYEYGFAQEHEQSIGVSAGLLVAIP